MSMSWSSLVSDTWWPISKLKVRLLSHSTGLFLSGASNGVFWVKLFSNKFSLENHFQRLTLALILLSGDSLLLPLPWSHMVLSSVNAPSNNSYGWPSGKWASGVLMLPFALSGYKVLTWEVPLSSMPSDATSDLLLHIISNQTEPPENKLTTTSLAITLKLSLWLDQYSYGCSGHLSTEPLLPMVPNKTEFSATLTSPLPLDAWVLLLLLDSSTASLKWPL